MLVCISVLGAHQLDLQSSTPDDPDWLTEQREFEIRLIEGWIDDYNQGKASTFSISNYKQGKTSTFRM